MRKYTVALLCCFQALFLIGQSSAQKVKPLFAEVIQVDSTLLAKKRQVTLAPIYPNYASEKDLINLFTNKYGAFKSKKGFTTWKTKDHPALRWLELDTTNNYSVKLKFERKVSASAQKEIIHEIKIDLKRTLMLWQERTINNQEIYFVGHRGGLMGHFEENTNDILKYSKQAGISIMEIDVLISEDDIPFMGHDWKYLYSKLKITKLSDSLKISKARYDDGQQITFFSSLIAENQFLILDLIHNSPLEQKRIVKYLYKYYPDEIKTHTYLQIDDVPIYNYIKGIDKDILVSYNLRAGNTNRWRAGWTKQISSNLNRIEMFVVNPSTIINSKFLENFDGHEQKIIPVVHHDSVEEIIRLTNLGLKFIMIDDMITVDHRLNQHFLNRE